MQMAIQSVVSAIHLDNQSLLQASEVDREILNRYLAAEVKTNTSQKSQPEPQLTLLWRHSAAQGSRYLEGQGSGGAA
jgi:phage-related protein